MITNYKIYTFDKSICEKIAEAIFPQVKDKTCGLPDYVFDNVLEVRHTNITGGFYWDDIGIDDTLYIPLYFVSRFEVIE